MPLPLVPVLVVAGAGAALTMTGGGGSPGAVAHPEDQKPPVPRPRVPPEPYVPSIQGPRAGGDLPADPLVQVTEGAIGTIGGEVVSVGKDAVVGAGAVLLGGGTVGEATAAATGSISAAASSAGSSVSSAASGAAGVVGPAVVVAADVVMVAGAVFTMFGGDLESALGLHGGPLSPEFDATTAAGQFHAREEAKLLKADLAGAGYKYASKGAPDPTMFIGSL